MMRQWSNDVAAHRAAPFLAQLVACGMLGRAEALAALLSAHQPVIVSPCGRQARLAQDCLQDDAHARRSRRASVAKATRSAVVELLQTHAPRRILTAAALRAGRPTLQVSEINAITTETIARHLRACRRLSKASTQNREQPAS